MLTPDEIKVVSLEILQNAVLFGGKANASAVLKILGRDYPNLRPKLKESKDEIIAIVEEWNKKTFEELETNLKELDPKMYQQVLIEKQKKQEKPKTTGIELPELPEAVMGKVVMRLAPYPSGALHLGNSRMAILNGYYTRRYNGKLILAFDDTIGSAEKTIDAESYDLIPEALEYLGIKWHETIYKSDRMPIFYEYAEKLIKMDKMYICTCPGDEWREKNKIPGIACAHRKNSLDENLEQWQKMLDGSYAQGEAVARLKTGMDQKDPALRDQIALRISEGQHPRVGDKYRVWPLLEYSWGIDDHLLNMTHIIRGIDLVKEGTIEQIIWDWFNWKHPQIILHGRVQTEGFSFSKSKDAHNIREGIYHGWDDPRTWSLQALKRRGFLPEAIWNTILSMGIGPNAVKLSPANIYHANRVLVDDNTPRLFGIDEKVLIQINNIPTTLQEVIQVPNHPTNQSLGEHTLPVGKVTKDNTLELFIEKKDAEQLTVEQKYARLLHLFNIEFTSRNSKGIKANYLGTDVAFIKDKNAPFIQWLPTTQYLTVPLLLENGQEQKVYIEPHLKTYKKGTLFQILRKAFVSVDEVESNLSLIFAHT